MKVKFKTNGQMSYTVLEEDETHYTLAIIGRIPKKILVEYDESEELPDIVDIAVYIANNKTK